MKKNYPSRRRIFLPFLLAVLLVSAVSFPIVSGLTEQGAKSETLSALTALLAPALSATKTAALDASAGGDLNGNGAVNPGDRLTYTVTINNTGADAATGVDC